MMITTRSNPTPAPERSRAGFTLPEVLLASALGAILLTSLATASYTFTQTLAQLEVDGGVTDPVVPVLGAITRAVREAWWIDLDANGNLMVADDDNAVTTYRFEDEEDTLFADYPSGKVTPILVDLASVTFEIEEDGRKREDTAVQVADVWASQGSFGIPVALQGDKNAELAFGFVPEVVVGNEQRLAATLASITLPLAYIPDDGSDNVDVRIYESRAPGSGRTYGSALGSTSFDASDVLPQAVVVEGGVGEPDTVVAPSQMVTIPLSLPNLSLEPGVGYVARFEFDGDSRLVVAAYPDGFESGVSPDVMKGDFSTWVLQPYAVPYEFAGTSTITATAQQDVVSRVTITIDPNGNRPPQARSATVLSQALAKDEWMGVVPGEVAP